MNDKGNDALGQGEEHGMVKTETFVASTVADQQHDQEHKSTEIAAGQGHHKKGWKERLYTSLWMNNVFFTGLGIIGLFFVAIQYAAQAGWSAGILRVPLSMGSWIPIA